MRGSAATVFGVALLALAPARAFAGRMDLDEGDPLLQTAVTGQGAAASVAWPLGDAGLTPKWIVASPTLTWRCDTGEGSELMVQVSRGPSSAAQRIDLRPLHRRGSIQALSLYLWDQAEVKKACARDGDVELQSLPIHVALTCPDGTHGGSLRLPLQVHCAPSSPSEAARTGVAGAEQTRQYGDKQLFVPRAASSPSGAGSQQHRAGQPVEVGFFPMEPRYFKPPAKRVTPVRLDASGRAIERYPPCPWTAEAGDSAECSPKVTVVLKAGEPQRFAYLVEYFDGTSVTTQPFTESVAVAEAVSPGQEMNPEARSGGLREIAAFVGGLRETDPAAIDRALQGFVASHPVFEAAGFNGHDFWARFRDGRVATLNDTRPKSSTPSQSPPAWLAAVKEGHAAEYKDPAAEAAAYRRALVEAEKQGPDSAYVAATLDLLAGAMRHGSSGRADLAATVPLYRREVAIETKLLGPNHPKLVWTLLDLAVMLEDTPDGEEAVLRQAVQAVRADPSMDAVLAREAMGRLSALLRQRGNTQEAAALDRELNGLPPHAASPREPDPISPLEVEGKVISHWGTQATAP